MAEEAGRAPDDAVLVTSDRLIVDGREAQVSCHDTRATIREKFGEPWDTGATSRRYPLPTVLVYGPGERLEFHFETGRDGRLLRLFREEFGRVALCVPFTQEPESAESLRAIYCTPKDAEQRTL